MLGIISVTGSPTELYRDETADFPIVQLKLRRARSVKRWVKRLAASGVSRAVLSRKLYFELEPMLVKYGIVPIQGTAVFNRLSARIAIAALHNNNIPVSSVGAEIYSGGAGCFDAVAVCSSVMRYVSVLGRNSEELRKKAWEQLGVSLISGRIPEGVCGNILRLYYDGRPQMFSVTTQDGERIFKSADICLPEKYAGLCTGECVPGFAEALIQSGKLRVEDVKTENIKLY